MKLALFIFGAALIPVGIFIALSLLGKFFGDSRPDHAEIAKNWSRRSAS